MSSNAFEKLVGAELRKIPGLWFHHPADTMAQRKIRLPGDFIYGHDGGWGIIECKETAEPTLPSRQWPPHQRQVCLEVVDAGGTYLLLVRYSTEIRVYWPAPIGSFIIGRGERITLPELRRVLDLPVPP